MKSITLYVIISIVSFSLYAQEKQEIYYAKKYLDCNLHSLEKYSRRIDRQQQRLLKKLKNKEHQLSRQLRHKDSNAYASYSQQALSYDSISRLLQPDTATLAGRVSGKTNKIVDSLKRVQSFLQGKAGTTGTSDAYSAQLSGLQDKLNYQEYINGLIDQRSSGLKGLSKANPDLPALKGIQKEVFYGKSKMKVWQQVADEPSKAEELALEYLQGTKDFSFEKTNQSGGMQSAGSEADLEKMGFQTKRQLNQQLKQQFGNNLGGLQDKMGAQVSEWQQSVTGNKSQELSNLKKDIKETRQSIQNLRQTKKPEFKVNPMRGLPFWKRVEKGYNFQTSRATPDGKRPAILELAGTAGFKHTPQLTYGLGLSASIGLGQNWSNIRLSYEGISIRSFATYELFWGIAGYGGYERFFKSGSNQQRLTDNGNRNPYFNDHNTAQYSESILLGLSKSYRINSKWNGAIQLLYDVWWKDKGLNSPVVLRFVKTKNNM